MGIAPESGEKPVHLFMNHGVVGYTMMEVVTFCLVGQFAIQKQGSAVIEAASPSDVLLGCEAKK
jgi:hypothetical protein